MDMAEMQDLIINDRARGVFRVNRRVFTDPAGQFQVLARSPCGLLFRERQAVLDLEALRPHGKLSFIL
jgi:hypothetical protein